MPETSRVILDGKINCIRRLYNVAVIGTDRSVWTLDDTGDLRRISSKIGILNNRCADGEKTLYILSTTKTVYKIGPNEIGQDEMDLSNPLSRPFSRTFAQLNSAADAKAILKYHSTADIAKVYVSAPFSSTNNDGIAVLNEVQSIAKGKPVWQKWNNLNPATMGVFVIIGKHELVSGDYNGFLWKLEDSSLNGDGAEENGTSTGSNGASTLKDTTKTWTVNAYAGMIVRIVDGLGVDQVRTIVSNTATELTLSAAWTTTPDATSEYSIGGFEHYHYSNWKHVLSSYEILKQLWFLWVNANAGGDYSIKMILQFDYDTSSLNQETILVTLRSENTVWGSFIWGSALWGSRSVYLDRFRKMARFYAVRVGFYHNIAGQPFQINSFGMSAQNLGYLFNPS